MPRLWKILALFLLVWPGGVATDTVEESTEEDTIDPVLLLRDARIECAFIEIHSESDYDFCIKDILLTRDVGLASLWPQQIESKLSTAGKLLRDARLACAAVQEHDREVIHPELGAGSNFQSCVQEVVDSGDIAVAKTWLQHGAGRNLRS